MVKICAVKLDHDAEKTAAEVTKEVETPSSCFFAASSIKGREDGTDGGRETLLCMKKHICPIPELPYN